MGALIRPCSLLVEKTTIYIHSTLLTGRPTCKGTDKRQPLPAKFTALRRPFNGHDAQMVSEVVAKKPSKSEAMERMHALRTTHSSTCMIMAD
jgi:hypothetical protein